MDGKGFLPVDEIGAKIVVKDGRGYSQYACIRKAIQSCGNMLVFANSNIEPKKYAEFRSNVIVYSDIKLVDDIISLRKLTVRRIYNELIQTKSKNLERRNFGVIP